MLAETHKRLLQEIIATARRNAGVSGAQPAAPTSVLFIGLDSEAKASAAEMLTKELGRDLHRVDLSSIVSKFIGETEKNLRRLFTAAAANGAVLFFDEGDALFGKRTEVKDAHDRFANPEINCLLLQLEAHNGIAILSATPREEIDAAVRRRFHFVVKF